MNIPWPRAQMCGFDLETTGVNTRHDRIVEGAVVHWGGGQPTAPLTWVSDVGGAVIPADAAAVHGWTTEGARAAGRPAAQVVYEMTEALAHAASSGVPLVAINASFDFSLLEAECVRYGVRSLWSRDGIRPLVLDPRVLDRKVSFRPGRRRLEDLCSYYGVRATGAHQALADAKSACEVVRKIGLRYKWLAMMPVAELHDRQVQWAREQHHGLMRHFLSTPGKQHLAEGMEHYDWPVTPLLWPSGDEPK